MNILLALTEHLNIKLNVIVDYACIDQNIIVIITNKVAFSSDLQIIENYIKNIKNINSEDMEFSYLPQLKSYLKISGILYLMENTNMLVSSGIVKSILKINHIFNNIMIILKSCIIKTLPKSDMAIVWLDIWNIQSSSRAKSLINRCFNVESYIATI